MKKVVETADGSHTIEWTEKDEIFHSKKGAWTESKHVFVNHGFKDVPEIYNPLKILEVGFGTGLNALLTWEMVHTQAMRRVHYVALEPEPVEKAVWGILNYPDFVDAKGAYDAFRDIHFAPWGTPAFIGENFIINKLSEKVQDVGLKEDVFNLVYFDAFSYDVDPGMWTENIFAKLFRAMAKGGILVTYAAKGEIRRRMEGAGFEVERLEGPPGKREMLRARKPMV